MKLIGLIGKARSGKDTVAQYLFEQYGFTRLAYADPVKLAAQQIFGLSHNQTWDDKLKEVEIPYWGMTPRQMFQKLGTDATHPVFGRDVWMKRWFMAYDVLKDTDDIVVPDVRYDLELQGIRNLGGVLIRIERGEGLSGQEGAHISENGITIDPDFVIHNNGSLHQLYDAVESILDAMENT